MKVSILGGTGWVGRAVNSLFPDAYIWSDKVGTQEKANEADIGFICTPTPHTIDSNGVEGKLDTSIVESCVEWLKTSLIVIRSTVNPGDCDRWTKKYNKRIVFQPEYLGESPQHPLLNQKATPFLILGGKDEDTKQLIDLYVTIYNANVSIRLLTLREAEFVKLTENASILHKQAWHQEIYDVCEKSGINYYRIRDAVFHDDPRFNLWWSFVYPDKRGANSKCIPKDVYAWCAFAESLGYKPEITRAILERNKKWINSQ